jgi:hypothetical protein
MANAPAAYTPSANFHFQGGMTGQDDGSYEQFQREQGAYQSGTFESMTDKITQGSDEQA